MHRRLHSLLEGWRKRRGRGREGERNLSPGDEWLRHCGLNNISAASINYINYRDSQGSEKKKKERKKKKSIPTIENIGYNRYNNNSNDDDNNNNNIKCNDIVVSNNGGIR